MSISKFVATGIALAVLTGGVSQAVAAEKPHKQLHFSVKGVAGDDANENESGESNESAEHDGADDAS